MGTRIGHSSLDQADRRAPRDLTARQSAWVASSKRVQGPMVRDPDFRGIIVHHSPYILHLRGIVVMVQPARQLSVLNHSITTLSILHISRRLVSTTAACSFS